MSSFDARFGAGVSTACDQEPTSIHAVEDNDFLKQFRELESDWSDLRQEFDDLMRESQTTKSPRRIAEIRAAHARIMQQVEVLRPKVMKAATAAWLIDPSRSADAGRLLLCQLNIEYVAQFHEKVARLSSVLLEHEENLSVTDRNDIHRISALNAFNLNKFESARSHLAHLRASGVIDVGMKEFAEINDAYIAVWEKEQKRPENVLDASDWPRVRLETTKGTIVVELFKDEFPAATAMFVKSAENHSFKETQLSCFSNRQAVRIGNQIPASSAVSNELISEKARISSRRIHFRGSLSMAIADDKMTFYLTTVPVPEFNGRNIAIGRVIEGFEVLDEFDLEGVVVRKLATPDRIVTAAIEERKGSNEWNCLSDINLCFKANAKIAEYSGTIVRRPTCNCR